MSTQGELTLAQLVRQRNDCKALFTAGPASLLVENMQALRPCFGRNDDDYAALEQDVLLQLQRMSGHEMVVRMQGSASLALEIMALNFLYGKVLIVSTGYYSERLQALAESAARRQGRISRVDLVPWQQLSDVQESYDWVWSCVTETSVGLLLPVATLAAEAKRLQARLMLDATASIGLEPDHHLAEVIAYSSCKGLFGLTGAAFIACHEIPAASVDSFYLDVHSHLQKRMTGPYHAICSLADVLPRHHEFRQSVLVNKQRLLQEQAGFLSQSLQHQPLLCTHVTRPCTAVSDHVVLYHPRNQLAGSIVCHLGEAHLGLMAKGDILQLLQFEELP